MKIRELICEARSHPELNPRYSLVDQLARAKSKWPEDDLYVHFGMIEKIGIKPQSQNIYGPAGVYAFPIDTAITLAQQGYSWIAKSKIAHVVRASSTAKILNLDSISTEDLEKILEKTIAWHKKKTKSKDSFYQHQRNNKQIFQHILDLANNYAARRQRRPEIVLNSLFRSLGYNAIADSNQILNDAPPQIVFLIPQAYQVLTAFPVNESKTKTQSLLEYDTKKIQALKNLLDKRAKDSSRLATDDPVELAKAIEKITGATGETIFWLLHRYLKPTDQGYGINRWEDIRARAIPAIAKFNQLKRKPQLAPPLPTRDLNQIPSLAALETMLDLYQDNKLASRQTQRQEEEQAFYRTGRAKLIYNDPDIKVVQPRSPSASCYFGKNTRWCTASEHDEVTFMSYHQHGPLYIILIKKKNIRYQFHFPSEQFMDELDNPINPRELASEYPVLWRIFEPISRENHSILMIKNPTEQDQLNAVEQDGDVIRYIDDPSEAVQLAAVKQWPKAIQYIDSPDEAVQLAAVKHDGTAIMHIDLPFYAVQLAAVKNDGYAIKYIDKPSEELKLAAVQNYGLVIEYFDRPSLAIQLAAVKQNYQAIYFIANPSEAVQLAAVQNNVDAIRHLIAPSDAVQLAAMQKYPLIAREIPWKFSPSALKQARKQGII